MAGAMMDSLSEHAFNLEIGRDWVGLLVSLLLTTLFIVLAARIVIDRASFIGALLTALVGNFLAVLVWQAVGGLLGLILALLVWGLVAALFLRTAWLKGVVIGIVAWIIFVLVNLLLGLIL